MTAEQGLLSKTFRQFVESGQTGGILLLLATIAALAIANSPAGEAFHHFLMAPVAGLPIELWINDGLMAIFFLLIGLELERELYSGELSNPRRALLPAIAAIGGMLVPAGIHFALNAGTPTQSGAGIPMATDIAFAMGALALLGARVPSSLKVFVVAYAVIDDLGAILVIAFFYSDTIALTYLLGAAVVFLLLVALNRVSQVMALSPYLIGGGLMWWLLLRSGVHPTLAGVALAFAIPYSPRANDIKSPSHRLEMMLHRPTPLLILPIFALANTGVTLDASIASTLFSTNGIGIVLGLVAGKPLGVLAFAWAAVRAKVCELPADVHWGHIAGAGMLGGIGFTMSIFIANLAFSDPAMTDASKLAILTGSVIAGVAGYVWLLMVKPASATRG